jgi:hypothetical protein
MQTVPMACPWDYLEKHHSTGSESSLKALENRKNPS